MHELKIELAIEEVNVILEGLGALPFAKVYALVAKIQEQAARQIAAANGSRAEVAPASDRAPAAAR